MATLVDCRYSALVAQGFVGATPDMMTQWLSANGGVGNTKPDLWATMLEAQGLPLPIDVTDHWYQLLGDLGYSEIGSDKIGDREKRFWCDGGGVITPPNLPVITLQPTALDAPGGLVPEGLLTCEWDALVASSTVYWAQETRVASGLWSVYASGSGIVPDSNSVDGLVIAEDTEVRWRLRADVDDASQQIYSTNSIINYIIAVPIPIITTQPESQIAGPGGSIPDDTVTCAWTTSAPGSQVFWEIQSRVVGDITWNVHDSGAGSSPDSSSANGIALFGNSWEYRWRLRAVIDVSDNEIYSDIVTITFVSSAFSSAFSNAFS